MHTGRLSGVEPEQGGGAGARLYRFRSASQIRAAASRRGVSAPHRRLGFMSRCGAFTGEAGEDPLPVPLDNLEPAAARRAVQENRPVLRPGIDLEGRTVILTYAPSRQDPTSQPDAMVCEVLLVSMLYRGEDLWDAARRFGLSNLTSRICVALVEEGSLRRASSRCAISHETARSEIALAMQAANVHSQSGLVRRLAEEWLCESLTGNRTAELLAATFGLTRRAARVAALRAFGLGRPQIAQALGLSRWAVEECCARVFTVLGARKAPDLTRIVVDLMAAHEAAGAATRATVPAARTM